MVVEAVYPEILVFPPDFHYMGRLFLPDPFKARLVGWTIEAAVEMNLGVLLDPGTFPATAREKAGDLKGFNPEKVYILGGPGDAGSSKVLAGFLEREGIPVEGPLIFSKGKREIREFLESNIDARKGNSPFRILGEDNYFAIFDKEVEFPGRPMAFMGENGKVLERMGNGSFFHVPGNVGRLVLSGYSETVEGKIPGLNAGTIYAFEIPRRVPGRKGKEIFIEALKEFTFLAGEENTRLWFDLEGMSPDHAPPGAEWALKYGLLDTESAAFLKEVVENCFRESLGIFHACLGFYISRIDPMEEIFIGNGIVERNLDLMANILE